MTSQSSEINTMLRISLAADPVLPPEEVVRAPFYDHSQTLHHFTPIAANKAVESKPCIGSA
jgi:hypothetical protein